MRTPDHPPDPTGDLVLVFRPWRRDKSGRILWARNYGLKAWPMWVKRGE